MTLYLINIVPTTIAKGSVQVILSNSGHKGSGKRPNLSSEEKKQQSGEDGEERRGRDLPMEGLNWRAVGGYRDPVADQILRRKSLNGWVVLPLPT